MIGAHSPYKDDVNHETCQKYGIEIARTISVSNGMLYQDLGSLNFTVAADVASFKHLTKDYQPVLSEYQILNESVARGLERFGVDVKADPYGIYIGKRRISNALPLWFHNYLLFQGTLHIHTNLTCHYELARTKKHLEKKDRLTSLRQVLGKDVQIDEVKKALVQGLRERLDVKFEESELTDDEQILIRKLHRIKYCLSKWNVEAHEPFLIGMGKTAVEVFVAYPPTSMCRKLIRLVNDVVSDLQEQNNIKVMFWMRGKGLYQHGPHPEISNALRAAHKNNIIPVVIINGELKFCKSIPAKGHIRKALLEAI